jgi:hypothetical protein
VEVKTPTWLLSQNGRITVKYAMRRRLSAALHRMGKRTFRPLPLTLN